MRVSIIIFLVLIIENGLPGQSCDYLTSRYDVKVEKGIFFGTSKQFDGVVDSLFLDIYKPVSDNNAERPLMIWCFGGGFFTGQKTDLDPICRDMARRGYVTATIDYRLGYVRPDGLSYPFAIDDKELIRAGFRAVQDAKGAIRFLKGRHETDSTDLDNIYIGGVSAGAITALGAAFVDPNDKLDVDAVGDLGTTKTTPPYDRPDLGDSEGHLHLGKYNSEVHGVANIFGALFDTAQIENSEKVIFSYHQSGDPIVPCAYDRAYWGIPFVNQTMPFGFGSCAIHAHLENIGYDEDFYETIIYSGNRHEVHNQDEVLLALYTFFNRQICGVLSNLTHSKALPFEIYPNPVGERLYFSTETGWSGDVSVFDLYGKQVLSGMISNEGLDVSHLQGGIYFLKGATTQQRIPFVKL